MAFVAAGMSNKIFFTSNSTRQLDGDNQAYSSLPVAGNNTTTDEGTEGTSNTNAMEFRFDRTDKRLSSLFFTWLNPIFTIASERTLQHSDAPPLPADCDNEYNTNLLKRLWLQQRKKPKAKGSIFRKSTSIKQPKRTVGFELKSYTALDASVHDEHGEDNSLDTGDENSELQIDDINDTEASGMDEITSDDETDEDDEADAKDSMERNNKSKTKHINFRKLIAPGGLLRCLYEIYGHEFGKLGWYYLVAVSSYFSGPLLLSKLVNLAERGDSGSEPVIAFYILMLFASRVLTGVL